MSDAKVEPQPNQEKVLQVGELFSRMAADPKYRPRVLGLIKEAAPETYIPEVDLAADVDRRVADRVKPFEDNSAALRKELDELKGIVSRSKFAEQYGLNGDEITEIEEFAKDNGITKGDKAVDLWRQSLLGRPRSTPQQKDGQDYMDKLRKIKPNNAIALKNAAIDEGRRIMRSMRSQRRAG